MGNRFHPATSAVASRDMPPTARMRASTIRSDSVSVVLPRLKDRQDHRFLGATSINGNLCTLRPLRLPFCQPAGQCLVSSNVRVATNRPEPGKDPNIVWMSDSACYHKLRFKPGSEEGTLVSTRHVPGPIRDATFVSELPTTYPRRGSSARD
jgi:hypothetical protein